MSGDKLVMEGTIRRACGDDAFAITCDTDGSTHEVLAKRSGRLRLVHVRLVPGDRVLVEVTPFDPTRGRITKRLP